MAKLIVYIAFLICCQAPNAPQAPVPGNVQGVEITTDYKADKLWDDYCRSTATTNVKEC
ncbi:hypothetical protein LOAG_14555 [Loa loa]|uniref:Uncharacterized protein n=1 Tax=Loa loa TaxID=7209 RepID=A0A1S0TI14_LOALO|nr:hypothetical protein LOAG_14555 [Loa loa]EFO13971.1 hypothetical protein LOAG_14555 [Loa loa]